MKKKPKSNHGGYRPGSGRPRTLPPDAVRQMIRLPAAMVEDVRGRGSSLSEVVRSLLEREGYGTPKK